LNYLALPVVAAMVLTACPPARVVEPPTPPPLVLTPETKVADDQTVDVLADVDQDKTLHFSAPTPLIDSFVPGDIVIFGVTRETPFGLLRRVTQVQREAGRIMV
jgi:hypothetical protein